MFSSVGDYVEWLNNDDMYALLFLFAEQAWRIGGSTELFVVDQEDEAKDQTHATQTKDVGIMHKTVVACLSNMVLALKAEFVPESTTIMHAKDRNPEIRSLAFICIAGPGKRGIAPLGTGGHGECRQCATQRECATTWRTSFCPTRTSTRF